MNSRTKITLAWQLHEQGMNNSQIAKHLEVHRETVGLWLRGVGEQGLLPFLDTYRQANKQSRPARQVPLSTKRLVWQLREREHGCCGQKIAYFLKKEHGIHLSVPKIYEILAERYVIRAPSGRRTSSVDQCPRPARRAKSCRWTRVTSVVCAPSRP